jgi:hypothetical protein
MTKTDLQYNTVLLVIYDLLVTHHPPSTIPIRCGGDVRICFRHNFSKNYLQDLKNSLERCDTRFTTI